MVPWQEQWVCCDTYGLARIAPTQRDRRYCAVGRVFLLLHVSCPPRAFCWRGLPPAASVAAVQVLCAGMERNSRG